MRKLAQLAMFAAALVAAGGAFAGEPLDDAKKAISRVGDKDRAIAARAAEVEPRAKALAARISALKAKGSAGRTLLEDTELAGLLRSSLEISRTQDTLADEEEALRAELKRALENGIAAAKTADPTDRNAVELLKVWERQLREMEGARRAVRKLDVKVNAIDGPQELREKADLLKDNEDRLRREIASLRTRLKEVNDERELRTEHSDFFKEQMVLEEEESRRGVSKTIEKQPPQAASESTGGSRGARTSTPTSATGGSSGKSADKDTPPATGAVGGAEGTSPGGASDSFSGGGTRAVDVPTFSSPGGTAAMGGGTLRTSVSGTVPVTLKSAGGIDFGDPADEAAWIETRIKDLENEAGDLSEKSEALGKMADDLRREIKRK